MADTDSSYLLPPFLKSRARTRIVCTIGPATGTLSRIKRLIRAGMSVGRLNLSHGNSEHHNHYVQILRQAAEEMGVAVGILADLPGPKYRVGEMAQPEITLSTGQHFILQRTPCDGTSERANVWPLGLHSDIKKGAPVLIDEGSIELRVEEIDEEEIHCRVTMGGVMKPNKAVTAPGNTTTVDYFTPETEDALSWVISSDIDYVGLSYVRDGGDVERVRKHLSDGGVTPQLVAKIEIQQAVDNLSDILEKSDAVMVARGDLGVFTDVGGFCRCLFQTRREQVVVQNRCVIAHGSIDIGDMRQDLIGHVDQLQRLSGNRHGGCRNSGHGVTVIKRLVACHHVACGVPQVFLGLGMDAVLAIQRGEVIARHHSLHTFQRFGF